MSEFETEVKEDVLMIGNISLEEIQAEEQRLREEHVKYQSQEATLHARYSPLIPPSLHRLPPMQYRCPSSSPKRDLFSTRPLSPLVPPRQRYMPGNIIIQGDFTLYSVYHFSRQCPLPSLNPLAKCQLFTLT